MANPAVTGWLANVAAGLGAALIVQEVSKLAENVNWAPWNEGAVRQLNEQGGGFVRDNVYGNPIPPVMLFAVCSTKDSTPLEDRMLAVIEGGNSVVAFEPWAWQGLSMFVHDLTAERKGDDLAAYRALCALALAPAALPEKGTSPSGRSEWMRYGARTGTVDIEKFENEVVVTATGVPTASGAATERRFALPTEVGSSSA